MLRSKIGASIAIWKGLRGQRVLSYIPSGESYNTVNRDGRVYTISP
jgi:hypothetical protein